VIYVLAELDVAGGVDSRYVKIGYTDATSLDDAEVRAYELQTGNPRKLAVIGCRPGGVPDEKALHAQFSQDRIYVPRTKAGDRRPTEWFVLRPGSELERWIESVRVDRVTAWTASDLPLFAAANDQRPGCSRCGWFGHLDHECHLRSSPNQKRQRAMETGAVCSWCGSQGHSRSACPGRLSAREHKLAFTSTFKRSRGS
jgi:hypothetical protein